jgi:3-oxoacyl-(acyl-carrier-protein) synthase
MKAPRRDPPVAVVAAAAVSAFGFGWRGLAAALTERARHDGAAAQPLSPAPSRALAATHPGTPAFEVPEIPRDRDAGDARARKAMSRPARLAAIAAREALAEAGWREGREGIGYLLGVGASSGPVDEMLAMLRASLDAGGAVSPARLGAEGLLASNPLFTFHVLNNFTLCHGAILEGIGGPSAALFSRGSGTVAALRDAAAAISDGDCDRALAGGADTAVYPVTWAELGRGGFAARGLVPGEGAAVLAIERAESGGAGAPPLAFVEAARVYAGRRGGLERALAAAASDLAEGEGGAPVDGVVLAPWGGPAREALEAFAREAFAGARAIDATLGLGEALAATPALAWAAAVDLIASGGAARVAVVSAGIDGDAGLVTLARERPA